MVHHPPRAGPPGWTWVNVPGLTITPAYPGTNNGTNYETYDLRFTPTSGDGIRIIGNPGGSVDFISVGELRAYASTTPGRNLTALGSTDGPGHGADRRWLEKPRGHS